MGILDGLNTATVYERGTFFKPDCDYELLVDNQLIKNTREAGVCFIAEFQVVASPNDPDSVGQRRTWIQKLTPPETALPAIKAYAHALLGYSFKNTDDKEFLARNVDPNLSKTDGSGIVDKAVNQDASKGPINPYKGRKLGLQTTGTMTRGTPQKPSRPFTRHDFSPLDTQLGRPQTA